MSGSIIPFPVETFELGNGLKTVVVPMPSNGLVSLWSIVRTGSRDEYEPGRTGFAHFFEHMMFRGTQRYSEDDYRRIVLELGADANAFTTDDLTAFHLTIASDGLERALEIESDRFLHLDYAESAFRTEAGAVYGEYRKGKTDPLFVLYEAVREKAFEHHSYGHTTMGYESDIAAMPELYAFSREFFARYYRPENTILLVCGDAEPRAVAALVEQFYGGWRQGYVAPPIPAEPEQRAAKRVEVTYAGKALPLVWLAWKIGRADPGDRPRAAIDLLVELSFGETSEVYRRLVLQEQSLEFLAACTNANRDPSLLDVYARVKDEQQVERVLEALDQTASQATAELVAEQRLQNLKTRKRYEFLMQLETPDSVARMLARPLAIDGSLAGIEQLYATYATLTPAELREAARQVLTPARRTTGVLRATSQA
jgi:zinc protease